MSVIEPGLLDAPPLGSATPGGQPGNDPAGASPQFFDLLASMGRDPANAYDDGQGWGGTQDLQASAGQLDPGPLPNTPGPAPSDGPAEASGRPARKDDDAGPPLPDPPDPPGPPTPGQSATAAAPGCYGFEGAGRIGGAVAGGTLEGLRQAAPGALLGGATGALAGAGQGFVAGAGRGFVVGAGAGALAGGGGAVPGAVVGTAGGATLGMAAGAVRGGAAGAVVGGAPGFAKGFGDGMAPGAEAGAGVGRWLDGTHLGQWVQGCPAPGAQADGLHGATIVESRHDPGVTQPTGAINGVPTGPKSTNKWRYADKPRATAKQKAQADSENQVADKSAAAGYRTVQNPTEGPNPPLTRDRMIAEGLRPGKRPDLLIENRVFDTYTPETNELCGIRSGMEEKIAEGQTHREVVDLRNTTHTEATIRKMLRANPIEGLREVIVVTDEGFGQPFSPGT